MDCFPSQYEAFHFMFTQLLLHVVIPFTTPLFAVVFYMYVIGWKHSFSEATIKCQCRKSTQDTCFWGFVAVIIGGSYFWPAARWSYHQAKNSPPSCSPQIRPCEPATTRARWAHSHTCGVFDAVQRIRVLKADDGILSALYYDLYSSHLCSLFPSVFGTNNAEVHRCIIYFSISGATTWTDDQTRLTAFICRFLLESRLWQEKKLFHPTQ